MTAKRDLKKRIRDRQAKTGESYTTARRHVLAARDREQESDDADDLETTNPGATRLTPAKPEVSSTDIAANTDVPEEVHPAVRFAEELRRTIATREPIQVDEVIDVSEAAGELGLACKVLVYERLTKSVEP